VPALKSEWQVVVGIDVKLCAERGELAAIAGKLASEVIGSGEQVAGGEDVRIGRRVGRSQVRVGSDEGVDDRFECGVQDREECELGIALKRGRAR